MSRIRANSITNAEGTGALGWGGGGYWSGPSGIAGVVVIAYPTSI